MGEAAPGSTRLWQTEQVGAVRSAVGAVAEVFGFQVGDGGRTFQVWSSSNGLTIEQPGLHRFVSWSDVAAIEPGSDALAVVMLLDGTSVTLDAGHALDAAERSRRLARLRSLAAEHTSGPA